MDYLFQDGGKPKKVGRPKGKASKNDKKTKTSKSKKVIKSKKGGNFLGSVGELIAPTGWEGFATTAGLFALDRADAALRRVKKEKINNMKGGADTNDPNNWKFDENGFARVDGSYVDFPMFNPRPTHFWKCTSTNFGEFGSYYCYAVNLSNLYDFYKDSIIDVGNNCKIIIVKREMSKKKSGGIIYTRTFWVNEKDRKVSTSKCNIFGVMPNVREVVENNNSINRKMRLAIWKELSDDEQRFLLNKLTQPEH